MPVRGMVSVGVRIGVRVSVRARARARVLVRVRVAPHSPNAQRGTDAC